MGYWLEKSPDRWPPRSPIIAFHGLLSATPGCHLCGMINGQNGKPEKIIVRYGEGAVEIMRSIHRKCQGYFALASYLETSLWFNRIPPESNPCIISLSDGRV